MTFEVEVSGRLRTVVIERAGRDGLFRVSVDGQPHIVEPIRTGEFGLSLGIGPGSASASGSVHFSPPARRDERTGPTHPESGAVVRFRDLHVTPAAGYGELLIYLDGRTAPVTVNGRRTRHAAEGGTHGDGEISIAAPMPGRVVRVLVGRGDEVAARQGIVVVEAMKMENELRAPRAGRIKEIAVEPGTSVEAGRVLAVIE